jgi:uncharacterized protein YgiM (DUF1202 family)
MNQKFRTIILTAAAVTAFAAPALADTVCTVNAPEIRLRKGPSKKARVIAILKKDAQVTTIGDCAGGWVKIASTDGRLSGYVGGWSLSSTAPKAAALSAPATTTAPAATEATEVTKAEQAIPVTAPNAVPTNEKLAVQITELRLNVLGIERDMEKMNKEIQKIKVSISRKKGRKHQAKKI